MHYIFLISFGITKNFKFQIYYSFLVQLGQLGFFRFTLVHLGLLLVQFGLLRSSLVHFGLFGSLDPLRFISVQLGPFGSFQFTSDHSVQFGPFRKEIKMLFCCDKMGATVGVRVFFGGAVLVAFQLDGYLVGWVIDKFPFKI